MRLAPSSTSSVDASVSVLWWSMLSISGIGCSTAAISLTVRSWTRDGAVLLLDDARLPLRYNDSIGSGCLLRGSISFSSSGPRLYWLLCLHKRANFSDMKVKMGRRDGRHAILTVSAMCVYQDWEKSETLNLPQTMAMQTSTLVHIILSTRIMVRSKLSDRILTMYVRRIAEIKMTLKEGNYERVLAVEGGERNHKNRDTYNPARAKIPESMTFCDRSICNLQTSGIGIIKISTSVTMCGSEVPTMIQYLFVQDTWIVWSQ